MWGVVLHNLPVDFVTLFLIKSCKCLDLASAEKKTAGYGGCQLDTICADYLRRNCLVGRNFFFCDIMVKCDMS